MRKTLILTGANRGSGRALALCPLLLVPAPSDSQKTSQELFYRGPHAGASPHGVVLELARAGYDLVPNACKVAKAEEHLARQLAAEAPEIACFVYRPGVVERDMQKSAREAQGRRLRCSQRVFPRKAC